MCGCNALKPLIFPLPQPQHSCPLHLLLHVWLCLRQLGRWPLHGRSPSPVPWPGYSYQQPEAFLWWTWKPAFLGSWAQVPVGVPGLVSAGLGSPLPPASHHPPPGGYWCSWHWPWGYGPQPFLWDVLASGVALHSTPADGASFISTTTRRGFKANKLLQGSPRPSALPAVPLRTCRHTNLLSLIQHSRCRALSSALLQRAGSQERWCSSPSLVCPFIYPCAKAERLLPKSVAHPAAAPVEIQDEAVETQNYLWVIAITVSGIVGCPVLLHNFAMSSKPVASWSWALSNSTNTVIMKLIPHNWVDE